jgi:hypothetical protein
VPLLNNTTIILKPRKIRYVRIINPKRTRSIITPHTIATRYHPTSLSQLKMPKSLMRQAEPNELTRNTMHHIELMPVLHPIQRS